MVQKKSPGSISCVLREIVSFCVKIRVAIPARSDYNMGCILSEDADITDFLGQAG